MKTIRSLSTGVAGCAALTGALAMGAALPAGAANPNVKVFEYVHVTTTIAKENQTVIVPRGTLTGKLNARTGALTATLALPPASSPVQLAGIGLATATFQTVPTKAVKGRVDFKKGTISTSSTFNIHIISVTPVGTSLNLVGNNCITTQAIKLALTGKFVLVGPSTFSTTYTIPPFQNCGLITVAVNQLVPGPGNAFNATFSPFG